jgi:hypothetical protein
MNNIITTIIKIALIGAIAAIVAPAIGAAWERREIGECNEWQKQSEEFEEHWFSTDWQRQQCEKHGIILRR